MKKVQSFLQGKKTYIIVVVAIIFNTLVQLGYLEASNIEYINIVLAALGIGALRAGVTKSE